MKKYSDESGFTLLEMIISIFIFSMVMLVVGTGMFIMQQSWKKVSNKDNYLDKYLKLEKLFTSSFRNAVQFSWPNQVNKEQSVFLGKSDSVSFAYLHRIGDVSDGGIRFIQYYLDNNKLIAAYRKVPILPWDNTGMPCSMEVLSDNVINVSFLYADRQNNDIVWKSTWDDPTRNEIPLAIQISITWKDGTTEQWLRRTAGSGKYESFGVWQNAYGNNNMY